MTRLTPAAATRSTVARLGLTLLVLLLGAGPALPTLHFALRQHRVCPMHGELMHVDGDAAGEPHSPVPGSRPEAAPAANEEHAHEHCGFTAAARERVAIGAAVGIARSQPSQAAVQSRPGAASAHRNVPLLAVAPKLAPPA